MHTQSILLKDLPDKSSDCACERIITHTVGLLRLFGKNESQSDLIGSGTLIVVAGVHAILTAEHVLRELRADDSLGLMTSFTGQQRRYCLRQEALDIRRIARGTDDSKGPDLGLVVLDANDIGYLRSEKIFYNLDARREQFKSNYYSRDTGFWFTCGVIGETMQRLPITNERTQVVGYQGLCGIAANPNDAQGDDVYDYLDVRIPYEPGQSHLPNSFGGMSGGGLWQVTMHKTQQGDIEPQEYVLSGVIFYQTAVENGLRLLRCHGRRSVYEALPSHLVQNAPRGREAGA